MALKSGDVLEMAIWMDGTETEEMKKQFEIDLRSAIAEVPAITGPLIMSEKKPGEDRVPKVPEGLQGPDVRLLVGEAAIIDMITPDEGYFLADLEPKDLDRLVSILRRVYQSYNPGKPELSLEKCYEFINQNGPEAADEALREQVGAKVH
jgi:hypothetical protein